MISAIFFAVSLWILQSLHARISGFGEVFVGDEVADVFSGIVSSEGVADVFSGASVAADLCEVEGVAEMSDVFVGVEVGVFMILIFLCINIIYEYLLICSYYNTKNLICQGFLKKKF
jgi:hypothetical protein